MLFLDVLKIVLAIFLGIKIEQIRILSKEMKREHDDIDLQISRTGVFYSKRIIRHHCL